jgi:hypothetical protein
MILPIYRVQDVIRLILFTFLLFIGSDVFSQQDSAQDSVSFVNDSRSLLEKKITFFCKEEKLVEIFVQLTNEHHFSFSYSDSKIQNIYAKKEDFKSAKLSDILEHLLENSGLTYLIIGTNIVIVKDKNQTKEKSDSGSQPKTTDSKSPSQAESHIYPSSPILRRMSRQEQKLLNRIYRKELRLKVKRKNFPEKEKDTISPVQIKDPQIYYPPFYKYYIKGSIAWEKYFLRYKNNSEPNWKNDLGFSSNPHSSLAFDVGAGIFIRNFIIESGIEFHTLTIEGQWKDSIRNNSPPPPPPPPPAPPLPPPLPTEVKVYSYSDHYSILSFPVRIYLFKQWKKFHLRAGPAIKLNFINSSFEKNKFKEYYESIPGNGTYTEKKYSISFGTSLNLQAGLQLTNKILLTSGLEYSYSMSPLLKNSIYNLYSNSVLLKISVFYFIGKTKFYK